MAGIGEAAEGRNKNSPLESRPAGVPTTAGAGKSPREGDDKGVMSEREMKKRADASPASVPTAVGENGPREREDDVQKKKQGEPPQKTMAKGPRTSADGKNDGRKEKVTPPQKMQTTKKTVGVSPAQRIADEGDWEEVRPMVGHLLAEEVKVGVRADQKEVFRRRCERGPFAAVSKGRFLTTLKMREGVVDDLALRSLAKSTVKAHRRMLRFLSALPSKYHDLNLDRAMEQYLLETKSARRWLPTTMMVKMATAHGALRLLPLYVEGELPVLMRESVTWMSAMKAAGKMAKQHPPTQPAVATWREVEEAIKKEPNVDVRMALLVTWLTCGRGGDVLLLKPSNVEVTTREAKGKRTEVMAVSFWKGKTVKTRGSYTVFTQPPPKQFQPEWEEYLRSKRGERYLFRGVRGAQIKEALRRVNPKLEQRSLRRGAIQALAATGLKDEELLHYSGHTNVTMLRRYLNFGKVSGEGTRLASQALALAQ